MTHKDVIRNTMEMADGVVNAYLSDLTDAELMERPGPGCNHIAWMLGHIIVSEHEMLAGTGFDMPALPEGFAEAYAPETTGSDNPAQFHTKEQYLAWAAQQRAATLAALASLPETDLDRAAPEPMREYCPTVGAMFNLIGLHQFMHAGQFVPVRRRLGKPVVI